MWIAAAVALLAGVAVAASGYQYHGLIRNQSRVTVTLDQVALPRQASHAAVWDGASGPRARVWVQAGVEASGGRPQLYIEAANYPKCFYSIRTWPARFHQRIRVRVEHHGDRWRVLAGGHASRWMRIRHGNVIATLELYDSARAVAHIDARRVS